MSAGDDRIRVLHVITRLDPGGSSEDTLLTAARMDGERFATTLAVGPTQGPRSQTEVQAQRQGVDMVHLRHLVRDIRPLQDVLAFFELWRLMRQKRFQIVHTHTSKGGLLGRMAACLAGVPVVIHTPHGHVFYGYSGALLSQIFIWLERWAARFTDSIIALTSADAEEHVRFKIAAPEKIAVIHSGVDFAPFDAGGEEREAMRRSLGIDPQGLVIGSIGRLTAIKGQADLIQAFAGVQSRVDNAWLLLVGDGEERQVLEEKARSLGLAEWVVLPGWREDIPDLLRAMDIFALPSLNEGMGKALVEAMYAGLAAVASRVGGIPELIEHGREGLLVPASRPDLLEEAMVKLAVDEEQRRQLGGAAAQKARDYSVESMIDKIEALYEAQLEEKEFAKTGRKGV
jgi:glycosyltransferase involved in cell wall biosynthesis